MSNFLGSIRFYRLSMYLSIITLILCIVEGHSYGIGSSILAASFAHTIIGFKAKETDDE